MVLASDCALSLQLNRKQPGNLIGAAPRNVSNRTRHLLPLELRKKLGIYREVDPNSTACAWAKLLDWYSNKFKISVVLFPFHTGTLSNDDGSFCKLVEKNMKSRNGVSIADPADTDGFLQKISDCRVMVTTPLHGAILSFASGVVPVCVSYSSKCLRFMEQAGLSKFVSTGKPGVPDKKTALALGEAWEGSDAIRTRMGTKREELEKRAQKTAEHFRKTFRL
jgi:polysaccharide pyruvyl transferase WcaK-like protein